MDEDNIWSTWGIPVLLAAAVGGVYIVNLWAEATRPSPLLYLIAAGTIVVIGYFGHYYKRVEQYSGAMAGALVALIFIPSKASLELSLFLFAGITAAIAYMGKVYMNLPHFKEAEAKRARAKEDQRLAKERGRVRDELAALRHADEARRQEQEARYADATKEEYRSASPAEISETAKRLADELRKH
ncbi:hypothetical protein [Bradyrhizobium manausense]|uniref:Uncharacterized protein n=1 Tax=Bradyrhizobium manausense TaxID=989370 RepID=A0A0R3DPA7_9BRAD|nr:hypothetical protein [Bradyrhizobium manausense]KRQ09141.1 hypothetical protein AOQ71_21155 [Bradyrhizobium manausense]